MVNLTKLKKKPLFIYLVVVPVILAVLYYSFFAIDRYVSTAKLVVRQPQENSAAAIPSLALLMGSTNTTSREETLFLQEFIMSADMMNHLTTKHAWAKAFADQRTDPFFSLSEDAPTEDLLKFYNRIVTTNFDDVTGLLEVEVQAPNAELAQNMLRDIIVESERFVNEISHKIARDQMVFAEAELAKARRLYEERRNDLIAFQSANNILDAQASAESRFQIIAGLETLLTNERATLKALQSSLSANSPQVRQQKIKISSIEQQLAAESKRLISTSDGEQLNVVASRYQNITIDAGIAEESYKLAVTALENARIEASKKIRSLVAISTPNLAQVPIYPERLYNIATILVLLLLIYGIARFLIATIEDHRD